MPVSRAQSIDAGTFASHILAVPIMSRPEEHAIGGGSGPEPTPSPLTSSFASGGGGTVPTPTIGNDKRGDKGGVSVATENQSKDRRALPVTDGGRSERDDRTTLGAPSPREGVAGARGAVGGNRAYQFRKAKSAATFMLDGVSYTIGEILLF